jgi:hypothetical protein
MYCSERESMVTKNENLITNGFDGELHEGFTWSMISLTSKAAR